MRLKLAVIALREREAMPSLFDPKTRDAILDRIGRLAPDRKPLWGRFTAPEMVCHVSCDLRQGLGELETGPPAGPLAHSPFNWLAIHVVPWPKGKGRSISIITSASSGCNRPYR